MKWCVDAIKNSDSLREIYIILDQREVDRRTKTIREGQQLPYSAQIAQLGINRLKNRYYDIYPYDLNRLVLINPIQGNDFINASWIQEPSFQLPAQLRNQIPNYRPPQPQTWIAAQGPLGQTCYEFLSLCLVPNARKRPQVIVQLTACQESGREKSANYIPDKVGQSIEFKPHSSIQISPSKPTPTTGLEKYKWSPVTEPSEKSIHGDLRVTLEDFETGPIHHSKHSTNNYFSSSFYRKNILTIELINRRTAQSESNNNELISSAKVIHYECTEWADRGVPDSIEPILELINSAKTNSTIQQEAEQKTNITGKPNELSPILVHCSAGVGRTGTLIAIGSFVTQLNQLAPLCPLDLKAQVLSSLLPPSPLDPIGRLPSLPTHLNHDLVAHTIDFLREQRVSMVQTESQIGFVYKVVAHLLDSLL